MKSENNKWFVSRRAAKPGTYILSDTRPENENGEDYHDLFLSKEDLIELYVLLGEFIKEREELRSDPIFIN